MTMTQTTMTSLRRRTVLAMAMAMAMAISAIGLAGPAKAQAPADLVDMTVVDRDTGQPLRVWRHDGRLFVAGQPGARYALRVVNHTGARVLVVMSVDGVNILTGETAGYGQRGYVFSPYEAYDITGWRKSNTEVSAFTFASLAQSYAARTGRPGDVGVIGIAAFKERVVPAPYVAPQPVAPAYEPRPYAAPRSDNTIDEMVVTGSRRAQAAAPPPPAAKAAPAQRLAEPSDTAVAEQRRSEKLGTAHGAREWSVTSEVAFERATAYPLVVRRIEYDTFDNLVAVGVIRPPWDRGHQPRPFPSNGGAGYVPDPPGGS